MNLVNLRELRFWNVVAHVFDDYFVFIYFTGSGGSGTVRVVLFSIISTTSNN